MNETPSSIVGSHVASLIRGDSTPSRTRYPELLQAMRTLLNSEAYPVATTALRNDLALQVLQALNARLQSEMRAEQAIRQAGRR